MTPSAGFALQISRERTTVSLEALSDHVLAGTNAGELGDDVALLIVRLLAGDSRGAAPRATTGTTLAGDERPGWASRRPDGPLGVEIDGPDVDKTGSSGVEGAHRTAGSEHHLPGNLGFR